MGEQNPRLTRDLSVGRKALFVPGCWPVNRRVFVSVTPFHARHIREYSHSWSSIVLLRIVLVESKTRTYHGRVEAARRTAGRRGGAKAGEMGCRQVGSPRIQPSLLFFNQSKNTLFGMSREARSIDFLCICRIQPGRTTGGSGRCGACRSGGAGRGWVGRDADGSVRPGNNRPSCPAGHRRDCPERLFGGTQKRNPM